MTIKLHNPDPCHNFEPSKSMLKPTIHEATFVAGDTAILFFVRAVHEISNATFYKLLENRQPVYFQATCRMYHAIFPCAACTNNNVAVSPATKVASCMVGFKNAKKATWEYNQKHFTMAKQKSLY